MQKVAKVYAMNTQMEQTFIQCAFGFVIMVFHIVVRPLKLLCESGSSTAWEVNWLD